MPDQPVVRLNFEKFQEKSVRRLPAPAAACP